MCDPQQMFKIEWRQSSDPIIEFCRSILSGIFPRIRFDHSRMYHQSTEVTVLNFPKKQNLNISYHTPESRSSSPRFELCISISNSEMPNRTFDDHFSMSINQPIDSLQMRIKSVSTTIHVQRTQLPPDKSNIKFRYNY